MSVVSLTKFLSGVPVVRSVGLMRQRRLRIKKGRLFVCVAEDMKNEKKKGVKMFNVLGWWFQT